MRNYRAFLKKEITEGIRTYKTLILLIIFLVFGIMNPLFAKLTPELLSSLMPEGMSVSITEPTAFDSWTQFFKNISQMGFIVLVIMYSGALANEISRGTLIILLTKGLSRTSVILSKYTSMALTWTACFVVCFGVTWGYTAYLFPGADVHHLIFSVLCIWLFGLFLLALLLFAATLVNTSYGCLLITGAGVVTCTLVNIIPEAYRFNPLSLSARNMDMLTGDMEPSLIFSAVGITGILLVVFLAAAVWVFRKKQL